MSSWGALSQEGCHKLWGVSGGELLAGDMTCEYHSTQFPPKHEFINIVRILTPLLI